MSKTLLKTAALAAVAGAFALSPVSEAQAKKVKWKMQAAFASTLAHLGPAGQRIADHITVASGGKFSVKFLSSSLIFAEPKSKTSDSDGVVHSLLM